MKIQELLNYPILRKIASSEEGVNYLETALWECFGTQLNTFFSEYQAKFIDDIELCKKMLQRILAEDDYLITMEFDVQAKDLILHLGKFEEQTKPLSFYSQTFIHQQSDPLDVLESLRQHIENQFCL